jgi:hypothetical protein
MTLGVDLPIQKAATAGAAKACSWGVSAMRAKLGDRKFLGAAAAPASAAAVQLEAESLSPRAAEQLIEFLRSPEIEHVAFALATQRMLRGRSGNTADKQAADIRKEFDETFRLAALEATQEQAARLADIIFDAIDTAVAGSVTSLVGAEGDRLPANTKAALTKSATAVAAATVRGGELLAGLTDLAVYRDFEEQLREQITNLHGTMRLPHAGTSRQVPYERLFVPPTVRFSNEHAEATEVEEESVALADVMDHCVRAILLGDPGGGKSTSSLKLAYDVATGKAGVSATVPFFVVLKDYAEQYLSTRLSMLDWLASMCQAPYGVPAPTGALEYLLLSGRALVVFDGLDELLETSLRREVGQVVEGFTHRYPMTPILVTSRRVGYEEAPLDADLFAVLQLREFSSDQVEAYVRKWFSLDDSITTPRKSQMAESFLKDSEFVQGLRVNPLMLSLMCGIYASENYIPRNRPDVYEKCALLLFDRWDKQRGINAPLSFDAHVQAAMRSLALWLYPRQESQKGLPREQLINYMKNYLLEKRFDVEEDAEQAATEFIDFCKGRAWVLTDVGAELYGFTHRTFLEYFAASQLVKLHPGAGRLLEELWPRVSHYEWDVVAQLATQILGKTVEDGADDFLDLLVARSLAATDLDQRLGGLSFACRALEFVVPRPAVLRRIIDAAVDVDCASHTGPAPYPATVYPAIVRPVGYLPSVTAENLPLTARYLRDAIIRRLTENELDERALVLGLFPGSYRAGRHPGLRVDARFWEQQAIENRKAFAFAIVKQREQYSWVASLEAQEGRITCRELVNRFGVRALYDYDQAGEVVDPPIAYKILDSSSRSTGRVSRWPVRENLVSQLYELLTETPGPWLNKDQHYIELGYLGEWMRRYKIKDRRLRSVAVLLALPLFELHGGSPGRTRTRSPRGRTRRAAFQRTNLPGFFAAEGRSSLSDEKLGDVPLSALELLPEAEALVSRWLDRGINLLASEPSGQFTAAPAT